MNLRLGNFMSWGWIEGDDSLTYNLWQDLLRRQDVLANPFAYADASFDVVLRGETRTVRGAFLTSEGFRTLGIDAAIGRVFDSSDESAAASVPVAMIGYPLWERDSAATLP